MKVPTLEQPRDTRPVSTSYSNLDQRTGLDSLAKGLEQAGAGIGRLAEVQDLAAKKAKAEAWDTAEAIAVTDWERRHTIRTIGDENNPKAPPGLFQLHGMEAQASAGGVLTKLDDDLEEVSRGLATQEQRQRFKQRMTPRLIAAKNSIESHAGRERRVAAETASAGLADTLLRAIPQRATPEFVLTQGAEYEQTVRALQRSPEEGDAKVAQWNERAAIEAMNTHLATAEQDPNAAQVALDAFTPMLDARAVREYQGKIDAFRGDALVLGAARQVAASSVDADGWMQEGPALKAAEKWAAEHGLTARQDEALQGKTALEVRKNHAARDERYKAISSQVHQTVNARGWWGTPDVEKKLLNKVNPPLYDALEARARTEAKQAKQSKAQAAREQALIDALAMQAYQKIEGGAAARAAINIRESPLFVGVSRPDGIGAAKGLGLGAIEVLQAKDKEMVKKGHGMGADAFENAADAYAVMWLSRTGGKEKADERRKQFKAEAVNAYQQLYMKLERPPTREEADKELAALIHSDMTKPGRIWGKNPELEYERRARLRKEGEPIEPARPPEPAAPGARGRDKDGVLWEKMPDGSARRVEE